MKSYETLLLAAGGILILDLILNKMGFPSAIDWLLLGVATATMVISFADFIRQECK